MFRFRPRDIPGPNTLAARGNRLVTLAYRLRGITLLELMIVTIIIGILAAAAYPDYREFTARAVRSEAKAKLLEVATNQERFYLHANRYGSLTELGYAVPLLTESGAYTVSIPIRDADNFTALASYNRSDIEFDRCASFSLDGRGHKSSTGSIRNCWTDQR